MKDALQKSMKVLIVDDDEDLREGYKILLTKFGFNKENMLLAQNGKEAMDLYWEANLHVHLVLTDYQMPIMDGLELVESLRKNQNGYRPYIVMISGAPNVSQLALEKGADIFIEKPITIEDMFPVMGVLDI